MAQVIQIENDQAKYEELDAQVLYIAVQNEQTAKLNARNINAHFPILADNKGNISEALGVLEDGGLSTPSVFIINKHRQIVWSEISHIEGYGCGTERVPSQTILENLQ
jgi:alkyl hydroperoxide reductase subunit AhpC